MSLNISTVSSLRTNTAVSNPNAGQPNQHAVVAKVLTKDHKPEDPDETRLIESYGEIFTCLWMITLSVSYCITVYKLLTGQV